MISPAVLEFINIFDAEGAFIFVERAQDVKPRFHVATSVDIRTTGQHFPTRPTASVLYASEILAGKPAQLRNMVRSIANDVSVAIVYVDTESFARFLTCEAEKLEHAPYLSGSGRLMDEIIQSNTT